MYNADALSSLLTITNPFLDFLPFSDSRNGQEAYDYSLQPQPGGAGGGLLDQSHMLFNNGGGMSSYTTSLFLVFPTKIRIIRHEHQSEKFPFGGQVLIAAREEEKPPQRRGLRRQLLML